MPLNYLLIESLQQYDFYYGDDFTVEFPRGSGEYVTLAVVAAELENRLLRIFLPDKNGQNRPIHDGYPLYGKGQPWGRTCASVLRVLSATPAARRSKPPDGLDVSGCEDC